MPNTEIVIFTDAEGSSQLTEWLDEIPQKARVKCIVKIERLAELGHELRRPEGDILRDGIYELRIALNKIQYRILYFFSEKRVILSHGFIKEGDKVPDIEIDRALTNKELYEGNPDEHTFREEGDKS